MIWNWAGLGAGMLVGFVVAPFLVHHLGQTVYGLWIVISSFTNYFGLLDLGIRGSVGRNIAYHRARGEHGEVRAILSTALAILCGAGLVALLGTLAFLPVFGSVFDIPVEHESEAKLALLLVGLNLALWLPLNIFDATLWAYQRFDLLNIIDIPATLLRAVLTFYLIGSGHGLVALALINLLTLAGSQAVKAAVSFRLDPALRLSMADVRGSAARRLFSYGLWYFLLCATRMLTSQMSPLLIGALLGVGLVTLYSIASRLLNYATQLTIASTGVLTPVATVLHAEDKRGEQQRLFLTGGKYCFALALFVLTGFTFLGGPLVILWMGPDMAAAAGLLVILAVGETLPLSQLATNSIVLAMDRHRPLACLGLVENVAAIGLGVLLSGRYGLAGVCVAFALAGAVCRGLAQWLYGCRVLGVSPRQYATRCLLPPLLTALPPAALLGLMTRWHAPASWTELILYGLTYGATAAVGWGFLVGYGRVRGGGARMMRALRGAR